MNKSVPTKNARKAKNLIKPQFFLCFFEIWTHKISPKIKIFTTKSYSKNCPDSSHEFKWFLHWFSSILGTIFPFLGSHLASWWLSRISFCLSWSGQCLFLTKSEEFEATKICPEGVLDSNLDQLLTKYCRNWLFCSQKASSIRNHAIQITNFSKEGRRNARSDWIKNKIQ